MLPCRSLLSCITGTIPMTSQVSNTSIFVSTCSYFDEYLSCVADHNSSLPLVVKEEMEILTGCSKLQNRTLSTTCKFDHQPGLNHHFFEHDSTIGVKMK